MKKKILLITLITTSMFMVGCTNKQNTQTKSKADVKTQIQETNTNKVDKNNDNAVDTTNDNAIPLQSNKGYYGKWVINKVLDCGKNTYTEDAKKIGKELYFTEEQYCYDVNGNNISDNSIDNPSYSEVEYKPNDFKTCFGIDMSTLGINADTITQVIVAESDKIDTINCIFFIKDKDTLLLYEGGSFFELKRVQLK